jgi:hypothetical protein
MATCARDSSHVYPPHNKTCPWCAIAATPPAASQRPAQQTALPPPQVLRSKQASPLAPGPSSNATVSGAPGQRSAPVVPRSVAPLLTRRSKRALALAGLGVAAIVLFVGLAASGTLGVIATSGYAHEARELIMDGMCNGGQGSTGHTIVDDKRVDYGLNRDCNALVLWSGTTEIRTIAVPGNIELELHVTLTQSKKGGIYVAAASMAREQGDPYTLAIFRLDEEETPRTFDLRAPNRGQGFPILGEQNHFEFERQVNGTGMVTAVDPDTGAFAWDVRCPPGWEYLGFWDDSETHPPGPKVALRCVQTDANRFRRYAVDARTGELAELVEDRAW